MDILKYKILLSEFPLENQGLGNEPKMSVPTQQPMTYGLILSSESFRCKSYPVKEGEVRIRNAMQWLIDNADLDRDNIYGWGLPQSWDAFSDGTVNPENQPYTITTAIVVQGILDALEISYLWTEEEVTKINEILNKVALYWVNNVWTETERGGYFWYSTSPNDDYFTPNVSSMFLGCLSQILNQWNLFSKHEEALIKDRIHKAACELIHNVQMCSDTPYWIYIISEKSNIKKRPNDLVHHVYTLWGIEQYRSSFPEVHVPWTLEQSVYSLEQFWKNNTVYEFPQDVDYEANSVKKGLREKPARLWGIGMMLAFYAKNKKHREYEKTMEIIERDYGQFPKLRMHPNPSSDDVFIARHSAHVLYGMAHKFNK